MWTRLLFAVRSFSADLGPRLGSWRLSIVLMVLAAFYYLLLAIWATSSPPQMVADIAGLLPFWALYLLLLVNTGVCLWRRLPILRRELARRPLLAERRESWRAEVERELEPDEAAGLLRRMGYRTRRHSDGTVWGVRRRGSALGTYLFHGAFFLVAVGFFVTLLARQEARVWISVGERYEGRPDQFLAMSPPKLLVAGVPSTSFDVVEIRPEFWRDQLLFTNLEADVELPGGKRRTTRINRPLWLGWGTFMRLSGFGYTPRYELVERNGVVVDSAFVKLNVFPPGQRDYFSPPELPHRIYVEVLPDFAVEDGVPVNRSLNLVEPAVQLQVYRGRLDLGGAVLRRDEGFPFEGLTLRFPEIRYWGEFTLLFDPGSPILFTGYLLGLLGLLLKLEGGREEAEWRARPGGGELRGWGASAPRWLPPGVRLVAEGEESP